MKYHDYLYDLSYLSPTSCGVYAIVNVDSGRLYVGSTTDLIRRASQHFRALEEGTHHNRKLQFEWDVWGARSFSFVVLERSGELDLTQHEQTWLHRLRGRALNVQRTVTRSEWQDWDPNGTDPNRPWTVATWLLKPVASRLKTVALRRRA